MIKKQIDPETANEIKNELAELRKQLETQKKAGNLNSYMLT